MDLAVKEQQSSPHSLANENLCTSIQGVTEASKGVVKDVNRLRLTIPEVLGGRGVRSLTTIAQELATVATKDPDAAFILTHHVLITMSLGRKWLDEKGSTTDVSLDPNDYIGSLLSDIAAKGQLLIASTSEQGTHFLRPEHSVLVHGNDGNFILSGMKSAASAVGICSWIYTSARYGEKRANLLIPKSEVRVGAEVRWEGLQLNTGTHQIIFPDLRIASTQIVDIKEVGTWSKGSLLGAAAFTFLYISNSIAFANHCREQFPKTSHFDFLEQAKNITDRGLAQVSCALEEGMPKNRTAQDPSILDWATRMFAESLLLKLAVADHLRSSITALLSQVYHGVEPIIASRLNAESKALALFGPLSRRDRDDFLADAASRFPLPQFIFQPPPQ